MNSPAWRHKQMVLSQKQATATRAAIAAGQNRKQNNDSGADNSHQLLLSAIKIDCDRISNTPKGAGRIPLKREAVSTFLPVIDAYIQSGKVYRNTALTQVMVWLFDLGDIDDAMRLADVATKQKQPMPERFSSNCFVAVADLFLEWAASREAVEPYFTQMYDRIFNDDEPWAVCDEVKVKYIKLAIREAENAGLLEKALALCLEAEAIIPNAGVKTRKEKYLKALEGRTA